MPGEKTEQPTPRRRLKAREQGQVPRSRELSNALATLAALFGDGLANRASRRRLVAVCAARADGCDLRSI